MSLRILLFDVGSPRNERNEPIGIDTLAALLINRFRDAVEIKLSYNEIDICSFDDALQNFRPHLIGISTKIGSFSLFRDAIRQVRACRHTVESVIVVGGVLATYAHNYILNEFPEILCVVGEGEDALSCIVEILITQKTFDNVRLRRMCIELSISNIAVRIKDVVKLSRRECVDLTRVPSPSRSFVEKLLKFGGLVRIEGSRGCPWSNCSFCSIPFKYNGEGWRHFPVNRVLNEIEQLSRFGAKKLYFTDEDFIGSDPDRIMFMCNAIREMKDCGQVDRNLTFFISTSVSSLCSPMLPLFKTNLLLKVMKAAGFEEIFLGIESGSCAQLTRYNKNFNLNDSINIVRLISNLGISLDIGFIMFDPEMTLGNLKENLTFIQGTGIDGNPARLSKRVLLTPFTPLTMRLHEECKVSGELDIDSLTYEYRFVSRQIQAIYDVYKRWEETYLPFSYKLQTRLRINHYTDIQDELRRKLTWLRYTDCQFLVQCVEIVERSESGIEDKLNAICDQYICSLKSLTY